MLQGMLLESRNMFNSSEVFLPNEFCLFGGAKGTKMYTTVQSVAKRDGVNFVKYLEPLYLTHHVTRLSWWCVLKAL